jgi:hypothetical protein
MNFPQFMKEHSFESIDTYSVTDVFPDYFEQIVAYCNTHAQLDGQFEKVHPHCISKKSLSSYSFLLDTLLRKKITVTQDVTSAFRTPLEVLIQEKANCLEYALTLRMILEVKQPYGQYSWLTVKNPQGYDGRGEAGGLHFYVLDSHHPLALDGHALTQNYCFAKFPQPGQSRQGFYSTMGVVPQILDDSDFVGLWFTMQADSALGLCDYQSAHRSLDMALYYANHVYPAYLKRAHLFAEQLQFEQIQEQLTLAKKCAPLLADISIIGGCIIDSYFDEPRIVKSYWKRALEQDSADIQQWKTLYERSMDAQFFDISAQARNKIQALLKKFPHYAKMNTSEYSVRDFEHVL